MIAPCQSFKMGTIRPHDLDIVHIVVCINHILIEVHVVGEAMLSDSFAHLQEHFVLLGRAKLLIRTNVEVVVEYCSYKGLTLCVCGLNIVLIKD